MEKEVSRAIKTWRDLCAWRYGNAHQWPPPEDWLQRAGELHAAHDDALLDLEGALIKMNEATP